MGILAVGLLSLAQLFALSTRANVGSRSTTFTAMLAQQKLEQLRGLTWGFDSLNLPISDLSTDLSVVEAQAGCAASGAKSSARTGGSSTSARSTAASTR